MQGKFIVIDGIDGSGTTTQAQALTTALQAVGHKVHLTREPSQGPIGLMIRQQLSASPGVDAKTLALLFAADRTDHIQREILPALERGETVICDRYILSSLAYQTLDCNEKWIQAINGMLLGEMFYLPPHLTFYFCIPVEIAQERIRSRAGVVERFDDPKTQTQVWDNYEHALREIRGEKVIQINATLPLEMITETLLRCVLDL